MHVPEYLCVMVRGMEEEMKKRIIGNVDKFELKKKDEGDAVVKRDFTK